VTCSLLVPITWSCVPTNCCALPFRCHRRCPCHKRFSFHLSSPAPPTIHLFKLFPPPPPPPHHHHHHCHLHHTLQIINWSCGYFIALLLAAIDSITSSTSSHPTASIAHALLSSHLPSFALHFCDSSFSSSSATLDYELTACILVAQVYSVEKIARVSSSILASSSVLHIMRHTSHVTRHTSHVTRHTSHVIRHTSHVTRHTSHVTHPQLRTANRDLFRPFHHASNAHMASAAAAAAENEDDFSSALQFLKQR
jgi:hypothetical protein